MLNIAILHVTKRSSGSELLDRYLAMTTLNIITLERGANYYYYYMYHLPSSRSQLISAPPSVAATRHRLSNGHAARPERASDESRGQTCSRQLDEKRATIVLTRWNTLLQAGRAA
eukprot:950900-Pleurochrysis_carterae.AAC.12